MQYSIIDASFSEKNQPGRGASAEYLLWELHRHDLQEVRPAQSDIMLVTCVHPIQATQLKGLRKRYPSKIIIVGGPASTSPYELGKYCNMICCGDGQHFLHTLFTLGLNAAVGCSNVWVDGDTRRVTVDQGFPWGMPPIENESGAVAFWLGRGCKNKCSFCQTGWAYTYSENPNPDRLIQQINTVRQRHPKIAYTSNDTLQHSFFSQLPTTGAGSYSFKFIREHGLPPSRTVRIGVEGVSARLRKSVKKPISSDDLVGCTSWLNANKKAVRWFMIADLPGETQADWEQLKADLLRWKEITPKGTLGVSFTAFCPDPATPLAVVPLSDDYYPRWEDFKEWFFGGVGWSNRIKIMAPQGPENRMKKAMASMGLSEAELRDGGHAGPNARMIYPYEKTVDKLRESMGYGKEECNSQI